MGKTRDLFKKIRDTKGTFHAKMGSIKDRNGVKHQARRKNVENWDHSLQLHTYAPESVSDLHLWFLSTKEENHTDDSRNICNASQNCCRN